MIVKKPRRNIIDYVAMYISNLPKDSPVNEAFGRKLLYLPEDETADESTVYTYSFPVASDVHVDSDVMGDILDVTMSNRQGVCVLPAGGGVPDANMGCYYPYFILRCRHEYRGRAFNVVQELIYELQDNAKVFPQNGTIRCVSSQPGMVWADQQLAYCFQTVFRVLSAEKII